MPVITKTKWQMVQCEDVASTKATFTFFWGGLNSNFIRKQGGAFLLQASLTGGRGIITTQRQLTMGRKLG